MLAVAIRRYWASFASERFLRLSTPASHDTTEDQLVVSSSSIPDGMQTLLDYYISGNITWRYSPI